MVMGCHGDIHLFSGPGPQLRGASPLHGWQRLWEARGGRESEPGNTRQVLLPTGLARGYRRQSGGPVSQVLKERDGLMGLRSRGRWRLLVPGGTNHDGGELGNAGKGVCASIMFSQGKHLLGLVKEH